jgi:hypothetical protein
MLIDFRARLFERGAKAINEKGRNDNVFLWRGVVYVGEAKFISENQSEWQAACAAEKILMYIPVKFPGQQPKPFVLFNQRIDSVLVAVFTAQRISVIVQKPTGGFSLINRVPGDDGLVELFQRKNV